MNPHPTPLFKTLRALIASLPPRRRTQLVLLLGLMLVGALAEVLSLGAIVPFLAILADPVQALQRPLVAQVVATLGLSDAEDIRWQLTLLFASTAVAATAALLGFGSIYATVSVFTRKRLARNSIIGPSPRFAVEALGMVLIALLGYYMTASGGGIAAAIPTLGALALGAQRLMPLLQQTYQPQLPLVLHQLDLTIPKGARVGFIGTTGSGKSTAMDLLMGLLQPLPCSSTTATVSTSTL